MVRRFICAETLEDALPAIRRLHDEGMRTTVDVLGESVSEEADARAAAARYVGGARRPRRRGPGPQRLAQAHPDGPRHRSRASRRETIGGIVAKAVELGAFVRIDMEDHTTTDSTLALWRDVRPTTWQDGGADVGLVIQSALRRSDDDIEAIIAEGGRVRLCKGAYKEPASVAYQDKADVDAAYERQMLRLMRAGRYPAIATHDVRLIKRAVDGRQGGGDREGRASSSRCSTACAGTSRSSWSAPAGRVRTYVPFGSQWYPYFMRRLAERPANVSFILRNLWRERGRG